MAEAFWDKAAAQGSEAPDGMDDLSELGDLVDQAVAVGFRPSWIEPAQAPDDHRAGTTISDMAKMVGWPTFALEHFMFGLVLGALALGRSRATSRADSGSGVRSAMLTS